MYDHLEVEKKWQKYWADHETFKTDVWDFSKPKFYAEKQLADANIALNEAKGKLNGAGIVAHSVDETIQNIGTLGSQGMLQTNDKIIEMMISCD